MVPEGELREHNALEGLEKGGIYRHEWGQELGRHKVREKTIHSAAVSRMKEVEKRVQEGMGLKAQAEEQFHSGIMLQRTERAEHWAILPCVSISILLPKGTV